MRTPQFQQKLLNLYETYLNELTRTKSSLQGWYNRFQKQINDHHVSFILNMFEGRQR